MVELRRSHVLLYQSRGKFEELQEIRNARSVEQSINMGGRVRCGRLKVRACGRAAVRGRQRLYLKRGAGVGGGLVFSFD